MPFTTLAIQRNELVQLQEKVMSEYEKAPVFCMHSVQTSCYHRSEKKLSLESIFITIDISLAISISARSKSIAGKI